MTTAHRYPETAEEIQAAARTQDWLARVRLYQFYQEQADGAAAAALLKGTRERYGPRMAQGLLEWASEESDEQRDPAEGRCGSQSDPR